MTAKEGQNMGVDRLLSAGLDCCIITKAEEGGPGAKLNLAPVGKVAALYDAILTRHFKDTFLKAPK